jgi:hypothetical protein
MSLALEVNQKIPEQHLQEPLTRSIEHDIWLMRSESRSAQFVGSLVQEARSWLMVDKAFLVDMVDLQQICAEVKHYSLSVKPGSVTITWHDGNKGLNDISFRFPIVADLTFLSAFNGKQDCGLHACLRVYTGFQIRRQSATRRERGSGAGLGG